jgi:hypothetical protein
LGKQEQEQEVKELAAALFRFGSQKKLEDKEDLIFVYLEICISNAKELEE